MTYFDFLFSQLFMTKLAEYDYKPEYDEVYDDLIFFKNKYEFKQIIYDNQNKSEYDCINDFLRVQLTPYIIKKYTDE